VLPCAAMATSASLAGAIAAAQAGVPLELGGLTLNTHKGTATLAVTVPAAGKVEIVAPKTISHTQVNFTGPATGSLPIRARQGKPAQQLRDRGQLRAKLDIFYAPQGPDQPPGGPSDQFKTVTLRLKR
jgi:hypothetical protein